jgi:hypothetical protein
MNHPVDQSQDPERQRQEPGQEPGTERGSRPPFDNSGLRDIPQPYSDDPPYQDWWVVESRSSKHPSVSARGKSG